MQMVTATSTDAVLEILNEIGLEVDTPGSKEIFGG
jgi:hypothetical protein